MIGLLALTLGRVAIVQLFVEVGLVVGAVKTLLETVETVQRMRQGDEEEE